MSTIKTPFTDAIKSDVSGSYGTFTGPQMTSGTLPSMPGNLGSGGAGEAVQFAPVSHISPKIPADLDESGYIVKLS